MISKEKVYILDGKRTPFGKFGGTLSTLNPVDLALKAGQELLANNQTVTDLIDQVIFANVIPSTPDTLYAGRHLALKLGLNQKIPGIVINRLCGSGIQTLIDATRIIRAGESHCVLVAGAENLSLSPHLIYGSRFGTKYGSLKTQDLLLDTLTDQFIQTPMGITAENLATDYNISREQSDHFSFNSHKKAIQAYANGLIQPELVKITLGKSTCKKDEHLRDDISVDELTKLRPTFKKDGVVTPGSASGIVDGACAMLIVSESAVNKFKLNPLAEIIDGRVVGVAPDRMGIGPVPAINELLAQHKKTVADIDLFEINEAFAPQVLACQKALAIGEEKLNIWGGAVALGHPLGATGLKITMTLARQLRHLKKDWGISSACIGGGQGIALMIKRV